MRKLASIRRVDELIPIPDADKIEVARIDGWNVIVQKGLHKVGDRVIYFEIDSVLPVCDAYEFLRPRCYIKEPVEGFRIRTMKMRGVVSQGLVLPIDGMEEYELGEDVTNVLDVKLYDPPLPVSSTIKGRWPSFIAKTDQERVQNLPLIPRETYEVTLKLDGTSETVFLVDGAFGICSRNYELKPEGTYWMAAGNVWNALIIMGRNLAVQGELMGPGIQKNNLNLNEPRLYVFDIWDIDEQRYLYPDERYLLLEEMRELVDGKIYEVPWIGEWEPAEVYDNEQSLREDILAMADIVGPSGKPEEGLVFKSYDSPTTFKAINNNYLLKEK